MADGRRQATTTWIRNAAREEFIAVGPRAFSLGGVAQRAHISKGAVYQRWPDKGSCLEDLIANDLPLSVARMCASWQDTSAAVADLVLADLTSDGQLNDLRFIAECVLAVHVDASFGDQVRDALGVLECAFAARIPDCDEVPSIAWWTVATLLANALLRTSGCSLPDTFATHTSDIVMTIGRCARIANQVQIIQSVIEEIPLLDATRVLGDDTSAALVAATQELIESRGISEADAREIARAAGMTTGALYRRFGGKSEVLAAAFRSALDSERYGWSDEFITCIERRDLGAAAETLASRMQLAWTDTQTARTLIDFTIAAHTDQAVLGAIITEMSRVADHRRSLFSALVAAAVIRKDLDPNALAWLIQVPTVGVRLIGSLGLVPTDVQLRDLMSAYLVFLINNE